MAEKPLSGGQNAFLRSFFLGLGGVFVLKSVFGFLIRVPEVPFLAPLKSYLPTHFWGVGGFSGVLQMVLRVSESKIRKHFSIQIPPQNLGKMTSGMHFGHSKVVFRPFYTFCTFYTNLPIRNDKMVNFQLKFHPTKQNVTKDIRPPMESS